MKLYDSVSASNAYNTGFLAGVRARPDQQPAPAASLSPEECSAWTDGLRDGRSMRMTFESEYRNRAAGGTRVISEPVWQAELV